MAALSATFNVELAADIPALPRLRMELACLYRGAGIELLSWVVVRGGCFGLLLPNFNFQFLALNPISMTSCDS